MYSCVVTSDDYYWESEVGCSFPSHVQGGAGSGELVAAGSQAMPAELLELHQKLRYTHSMYVLLRSMSLNQCGLKIVSVYHVYVAIAGRHRRPGKSWQNCSK